MKKTVRHRILLPIIFFAFSMATEAKATTYYYTGNLFVNSSGTGAYATGNPLLVGNSIRITLDTVIPLPNGNYNLTTNTFSSISMTDGITTFTWTQNVPSPIYNAIVNVENGVIFGWYFFGTNGTVALVSATMEVDYAAYHDNAGSYIRQTNPYVYPTGRWSQIGFDIGFVDVPVSHWAYNHIMAIYGAGITSGCKTNPPQFCPDSAITRGQMATFVEISLVHTWTYCRGRFTDVPIGAPFCAFIERMAEDGITGGCGGNNFCPNDPVTRGQMAVFIESALGNPANACTGRFLDVPANDPFCGFIERLEANGITGGCGGGNFCPSDPVTRAQMAVFLIAAPPPLTP